MSNWRREYGMDHVNNTDYVIFGIVILSLIGLFSRMPILFVVIGILVTYLIISDYYNKKIVKNLTLLNPRQTIRLFPGEEEKVIVELQNESFIPIVNGQFTFQVDPVISALAHKGDKENEVVMPLTVMGNRKATITLPIRANYRGVSRVKSIKYTFPHLLNFNSISLHYSLFYHTEIIVFPKLVPVVGLEAVFQMMPGAERTNFSPFDDIQSVIGTRNYQYGDSFQRINWKATAKTQQLQTNMYEMVVDMSYVFIVNISTYSSGMISINQEMEDLLSYVAYLSNHATKNEFPFEVYINARKPGRVPYVYIPEGEDKAHYLYTLETLARIQSQAMTIPFEQMLYRIDTNLYKPTTIILIGDLQEESSQMLSKWTAQGHSIFQVSKTNDNAVINPWTKDVINHA